VLCPLYLVIMFSLVGLITIGIGLALKSIRSCRKASERKELLLIFTMWIYLSIQVASIIFGYLATGGSIFLNDNTDQSASNSSKRQVNPILGMVAVGLQLVWLIARSLFGQKIIELFSFMFLQFVDPRILEMKTPDLKIKINYPLFLKKSKSNMFQKAIREDFESHGLKGERAGGKQASGTTANPQAGGLQLQENLKKSEKLKQQQNKGKGAAGDKPDAGPSTAKENILSSGGFYSSRGGTTDKIALNYSTDIARGNRYTLGKKDQIIVKEHFQGEQLDGESSKISKQNRRVLIHSARSH
jgi:hypothetical protein